jgi:hypothetical protein
MHEVNPFFTTSERIPRNHIVTIPILEFQPIQLRRRSHFPSALVATSFTTVTSLT